MPVAEARVGQRGGAAGGCGGVRRAPAARRLVRDGGRALGAHLGPGRVLGRAGGELGVG